MAYVKTNWVDDVTPLSATNMNNIENGFTQVSKYNAYQSLEITKLRMELVLTQLNSVGFYDLFDTTDDVNLALTDATVDTGTQDVIFIGDKNLVMNEQQFAVTADNALIKLYTDDTTFNYATVESDVTDASAVTVAENLAIGDKLWTDSENAITDVVDSTVGFDIANGSYDSISFSIASQELNPSSIAFNNDGTKLFMIGRVGNTIYQYSLPTPFVLTGMSYDSVSFSVSSQDTSSRSIAFNNDGTKLFLLGDTNDKIYQYSLPTPFVLTGMSYDNISFSVNSQDTSPTSITFNNDGTKLFMVGSSNDTIYQYSTSEILFDLTLTSPITALADDVLSVYPSAYPYDTLTMESQQFAVTGDNALVKLYTEDINNPLDLKYQVFINGVECSLVETLDYELTFELTNINSDTIILKVNGKNGVVLDDVLVAIS